MMSDLCQVYKCYLGNFTGSNLTFNTYIPITLCNNAEFFFYLSHKLCRLFDLSFALILMAIWRFVQMDA